MPHTAHKRCMSSDALLPKLHAIRSLCRGPLPCYYPATATPLATDTPLSKWCIAHRPPFPDPSALKYTPLASKVFPLVPCLLLFYLYKCWAFTLWTQLVSCSEGVLWDSWDSPLPLTFAQYTSLDPLIQCILVFFSFSTQCLWPMRTLFSNSSKGPKHCRQHLQILSSSKSYQPRFQKETPPRTSLGLSLKKLKITKYVIQSNPHHSS